MFPFVMSILLCEVSSHAIICSRKWQEGRRRWKPWRLQTWKLRRVFCYVKKSLMMITLWALAPLVFGTSSFRSAYGYGNCKQILETEPVHSISIPSLVLFPISFENLFGWVLICGTMVQEPEILFRRKFLTWFHKRQALVCCLKGC